jgi:hypothetical protein
MLLHLWERLHWAIEAFEFLVASLLRLATENILLQKKRESLLLSYRR